MAGTGKELKGSLKESVGKLIGDGRLEAKGRVEKIQGRTRRRAGALPKEVKGMTKEAVGKLTGNIGLEYEGKLETEVGREQSR